MKYDDIIKNVIYEEKFIPNRLMPLEGSFTKLNNTDILKKRGYTLKTEPSNIREIYQKQTSINVLNERR